MDTDEIDQAILDWMGVWVLRCLGNATYSSVVEIMADTAQALALQVAADFFAQMSKQGLEWATGHCKDALRTARNDALDQVKQVLRAVLLEHSGVTDIEKAIDALKDRT